MRGPIDYIIVAFEGNKFSGEIVRELEKAVNNKIINVLALALIVRDKSGSVTAILELDEETFGPIANDQNIDNSIISSDDVEEVGELLEDNSSAGLLIIEHVWAKDLKKAIINANGTLLSEGRIHPEASEELNVGEDS